MNDRPVQTKAKNVLPDLSIMRRNLILHWQAGSHLWGTDTPESDHDYVAVWIPPSDQVLGLAAPCPAVYTESTAPVSENGSVRAKSTALDEETKWYTIQEFVKRIVIGDVNLTPLLWASPRFVSALDALVTIDAARLVSQDTLTHHVMQVVSRQQSIEKRMRHDETDTPDPKAAMHMVRVATQAFDLAVHGKIETPGRGSFLREVRAGDIDWPILVNFAKEMVTRTACIDSLLPRSPDLDRANRLIRDVMIAHWQKHENKIS